MGCIAPDQLSIVGEIHQIRHLESSDGRHARSPERSWKRWRSRLLDGRFERSLSKREYRLSTTILLLSIMIVMVKLSMIDEPD